ncbi:MAG: hypothetical protein IJS90_07915 [Clostridia bacterium]|nr:hypothetical protein [Clostridia bacterium]
MKKTKKLLSALMALILCCMCFMPLPLNAVKAEASCSHNRSFFVTRPADGCIPGNGYYECSVCGEHIETEIAGSAHTFKWVVDQHATQFTAGRKHQVCEKCGLVQNMNTKIPVNKQTKGFSDSISQAIADFVGVLKYIVEQIRDFFVNTF